MLRALPPGVKFEAYVAEMYSTYKSKGGYKGDLKQFLAEYIVGSRELDPEYEAWAMKRLTEGWVAPWMPRPSPEAPLPPGGRKIDIKPGRQQ